MSPRLSIAIRTQLADFPLEVEFASDARCVGVFGPSGSGKTSLLESIAGWRTGVRGKIEVGGRMLHDDAAGIDLALHERGVGYVPQDALLFPHWDVAQNLRAHGRRTPAGPDGEADFERAVHVLGLESLLGRSTATLSGGERQRVALARALVSRPSVLLLDEPLGGVDVALRRRILPWLVRLRDVVDVPIVFVSHDPTEVQVLCDEVVALDRGQVSARGPAASTLRRLLASDEHFENVLEGRVALLSASTARIDVGGIAVHVARDALELGQRAAFALGSDDILLAVEPPQGLSARNVLRARVETVRSNPTASRVDLTLATECTVSDSPSTLEGTVSDSTSTLARAPDPDRVTLSATLSSEAIDQLRIVPGRAVFAVFKSSSCQVLSPPAEPR